MRSVGVILGQLKKYVAQLNLFEDQASRLDPFHLRAAIVSTRIYITLLTASIIILIVFTSLETQSQINIIRNPSQSTYEGLLDKNVTPLACPCSRLTIPYGHFTETIVDYHPVCSSFFVSKDWIDNLFSPDIGRLYQADFRASASGLFQLLAAFCSHANRSVHDALDDFYYQTLLTTDVLLPISFKDQVTIKSEFVRTSTINSVLRLLQIVRTTTHANELKTVLQTSKLSLKQNVADDVFHLVEADISFFYVDSTECKCKSNRNCSMPTAFFDINQIQLSQTIVPFEWIQPVANLNGFFVGCNPIESLLQSTLECLFDSSCLATIGTFIPSTNIIAVRPLNTSQTRFAMNMSIETIINDLFIENWSTQQSFSNYFSQCAPIQCTYTTVQDNNALYVLTKLLGIYGGLTAALRFCVPLVIAWCRKRRIISSVEPRPGE